jgi:hypothetical protein
MIPRRAMFASPGRVNIFNATVSASGAGAQGVSYTLSSTGQGSGTGIANWTWLIQGLPANFQAKATLISGTQGGGTYGSWVSLSTSPNWGLTESLVGTLTNVTQIQIRNNNGAIIATANITMTATRTS